MNYSKRTIMLAWIPSVLAWIICGVLTEGFGIMSGDIAGAIFLISVIWPFVILIRAKQEKPEQVIRANDQPITQVFQAMYRNKKEKRDRLLLELYLLSMLVLIGFVALFSYL